MKITLKITQRAAGSQQAQMVGTRTGEDPNTGGDECLCADAFKFKSNQIDLLTVPISFLAQLDRGTARNKDIYYTFYDLLTKGLSQIIFYLKMKHSET